MKSRAQCNDAVDQLTICHEVASCQTVCRTDLTMTASLPLKPTNTFTHSFSVLSTNKSYILQFLTDLAYKIQNCTTEKVTSQCLPECTFIFTRDSILCCSAYMASPVRLSVRLSHGWISQKRLKSGSCNFHHRVAPSL